MRSKSKRRIIVGMDFGGTLDGNATSPQALRWQCYHNAGYRFPDELLKEAHIYAREQILMNEDRKTWNLVATSEKWFTYECEYLGIDQRLAFQWAKQDADKRRIRLAEARPVITDLSLEYELVLISNNIGNLQALVLEAGLASAFRVVLDSSECGIRKPDPRIFFEAQRRLGLGDSSSCWYIGDKYENDVIGAQAAGWNAAWLVNKPIDRVVPTTVLVVTSIGEFQNELHKRYQS